MHLFYLLCCKDLNKNVLRWKGRKQTSLWGLRFIWYSCLKSLAAQRYPSSVFVVVTASSFPSARSPALHTHHFQGTMIREDYCVHFFTCIGPFSPGKDMWHCWCIDKESRTQIAQCLEPWMGLSALLSPGFSVCSRCLCPACHKIKACEFFIQTTRYIKSCGFFFVCLF